MPQRTPTLVRKRIVELEGFTTREIAEVFGPPSRASDASSNAIANAAPSSRCRAPADDARR